MQPDKEHLIPKKCLGLDRFDLGALVLLLVGFLIVARLPFAAKPFGDLDFHVEAKALAGAIRGQTPWSEVAITKAPGPVLYYAVPYLLVPVGGAEKAFWRAAVLWNGFWMSVALLLLRRAATMVGGHRAGLIAVGLTLISPFQIYYSFGINAETPANLGVLLAIYAWYRAAGKTAQVATPWREPIFLAGGLAMFVLSRPNALLILPLLGVVAHALVNRSSGRGRLVWKSAALVLLAVIASALAARALPGRAGEKHQGSYLAHVMLHGSFQYRTETWDWRFWDSSNRRDSADYQNYRAQAKTLAKEAAGSGVPLATLQYRWVVRDVLFHPWLRLKMAAVRLLSLHTSVVSSVLPSAFRLGPLRGAGGYWAFHVAINIINLIVLFAAASYLVRNPQRIWVDWPLWAPWLVLLAFHVIVYAEARYLFPARPGVTILAAAALGGWRAQGKKAEVRLDAAALHTSAS